MLTTERSDWLAALRRLREHGMSVSAADRHAAGDRVVLEQYLEVGFNYRMTDMQAAVGLVQLGKLDAMVARRRAIVGWYRDRLAGLDLQPVVEPEGAQSNYQSFWVRLGPSWPVSRNATLQGLAERGIQARRGIMAAHLEPAYAQDADLDLPATRALAEESLILPVFHAMTEEQVDEVVAALAEVAGGG
jgi:perosamine synthetase